jgi:hypothetical protein
MAKAAQVLSSLNENVFDFFDFAVKKFCGSGVVLAAVRFGNANDKMVVNGFAMQTSTVKKCKYAATSHTETLCDIGLVQQLG